MKISAIIAFATFMFACQQTSQSADNPLVSTVKMGQNDDYEKYCNERFDHCISFPKGFTSGNLSQNGDGKSFYSSDKKTEITFSGSILWMNLIP